MTYTKADFPNNFPPDWDVTFDKHGDGCVIDFPIRLYPHIKFAPVFYRKVDDSVEVCNRDFMEIVTVSVTKKNRC